MKQAKGYRSDLQDDVTTSLPTKYGTFQVKLYSQFDGKEHLAIIFGEPSNQENVVVRVHSECLTGDVFGSLRCDCGSQLDRALTQISTEKAGVLIYLRQEGRGIGLSNKLKAYNLQDQGHDTVKANLALGFQADERRYDVAAQIIQDLHIKSIRLLTNNPEKIQELSKLGITVRERVSLPPRIFPENVQYIKTKVQKMGHQIDLSDTRLFPSSLETYLERLPAVISQHAQQHQRPFITLTYAQSLDGCIAPSVGESLCLSGEKSLRMTHQLRAIHEAILVGIGTVLADNPQLNVRLIPGDNPIPIVLDSHLRFPLDSQLLSNGARPWIMTSQKADKGKMQRLEQAGAKVVCFPQQEGQLDLLAIQDFLWKNNITSLMVEGGSQVIRSFLQTQLVDNLIITIAKKLLGGLPAIQGFSPQTNLSLENLEQEFNGEDIIVFGQPAWKKEKPENDTLVP